MRLERMVVPFQFKAAGGDGAEAGTFTGYGSVFGPVDSYGDVIAPGAFKQTLREWKAKKKLPKMLLQHGGGFFGGAVDDLVPVGKYLDMQEDEYGLAVEGRLFMIDTDRVKGMYAAMKEGELDGLSIGFRTRKSEMNNDTGIRTITDIELWECSIVTFPANAPALVDSVKAANELPTEIEFERLLRRQCGLTEVQAKAVIARGFRQMRSDAQPPAEDLRDLLDAARRLAPVA